MCVTKRLARMASLLQDSSHRFYNFGQSGVENIPKGPAACSE